MGNCCGSQAVPEDSSYPTGAAISRPQKSSSSTRPKARGPGRTLGGGPSEGASITPDARASAALAAEVYLYVIYLFTGRWLINRVQRRHNETGKGGKLANQLAADRGKSRQQHLKDASTERQAQADQAALTWD